MRKAAKHLPLNAASFIEFVYQANYARSAIVLSRPTMSLLGSRFKLMPILDGLLSTIEQR
jgi:hypothetical protein